MNKKKLIDRINEHVINRSFDRKQILLIYEIMAPFVFKISELENEVDRIADSQLNLEEISKILTGAGRTIYLSNIKQFFSCMKQIIQLNKEELNVSYLSKILNVLSIISASQASKEYLSTFLMHIENNLHRWKKNDLLSIIKIYKNNNLGYQDLHINALKRLNAFLCNSQPIEFVTELASLLKNSERKNYIADEIFSKSYQIIKEKLSKESIDFENLKQILDFIGPNIDHQTALLLADQINSKNFSHNDAMEIFSKASWLLCINKEGKLFSLADLIQKKFSYNQFQKHHRKIDILISIILTKNYEMHGLQEIKEYLIDEIKESITLSIDNLKKFINTLKDKEYSSKLYREWKPLQATAFRLLEKTQIKNNSLHFSMFFYESNPEKWKDFVIENKNIF
ncbi:unnamed protein product [Blepharisma stoltei]|uniref:Uncharacterized protein n=1 Tax=Blepharisma stoltei TaxID=1481888 RepID=A0AAU9JYA7_9CILI|nr:unnamed protein product [Blepharisma stoltei]